MSDDRGRQSWVEAHCRARLEKPRYLKLSLIVVVVVMVGALKKPSQGVEIEIQLQREESRCICLFASFWNLKNYVMRILVVSLLPFSFFLSFLFSFLIPLPSFLLFLIYIMF